jgi:AcrR family transcriptional regulator/transcriptional regulator with XRE-family HTH domain
MASYQIETVVGERIRDMRRERGWSMRALADRVGVSAATISAVENGKTGVSLARLAQFADVFGTHSSVLMSTAAPRHHLAAVTDETHRNWRVFEALQLDPALTAAISNFVATGYHGASMRDIAHSAGMSLSGIYHHYSSKQALLRTILDVTMDDLEWRIDAAVAEGRTAADRMHLAVEALALFHATRTDLAFIGASEMRSFEESERTAVAARRSALQHVLDALVLGAIAEQTSHCAHPLAASRAIATMCTSLPQWFDPRGPASAETIALEYADLALRMLSAPLNQPRRTRR